MKILVFSPYYPPHIGGLETHADQFNKYLAQKGVEIVVATPRFPKDTPEQELKYNRVKILRFPAFEIIHNYPLPKFWSLKFWQILRLLFKQKFNIVISRTRFFNTSLLALFYAKIKRVAWIHIEHGSDFVKSGGNFTTFIAKIYDQTIGKTILKMADIVVANSNASAIFCKKIARGVDCEIVYRGIEMEEILSADANLTLKNKFKDSVIITFLGRLFNGKGVADLLEALARIKNNNYTCFIIGDGPEKKKLETLAKKLKLDNKIIFFGYQKFEDYIKILKITDIFVNPSYTEGLPTTVAEASLCQNAIIATNVGGTPEIITDEQSGYLIKPKDITSLKKKLEILIINKQLRKKLGANAYKEVKNKFSWEQSIEKYVELFNNLKN